MTVIRIESSRGDMWNYKHCKQQNDKIQSLILTSILLCPTFFICLFCFLLSSCYSCLSSSSSSSVFSTLQFFNLPPILLLVYMLTFVSTPHSVPFWCLLPPSYFLYLSTYITIICLPWLVIPLCFQSVMGFFLSFQCLTLLFLVPRTEMIHCCSC